MRATGLWWRCQLYIVLGVDCSMVTYYSSVSDSYQCPEGHLPLALYKWAISPLLNGYYASPGMKGRVDWKRGLGVIFSILKAPSNANGLMVRLLALEWQNMRVRITFLVEYFLLTSLSWHWCHDQDPLRVMRCMINEPLKRLTFTSKMTSTVVCTDISGKDRLRQVRDDCIREPR